MQPLIMERLSQFFGSSLLLLFGMAVVTASLQSLHAKQTFASQGIAQERPSSASTRVSQLLDEKIPGSMPYTFSRGVDKVTLLLDSPEDRVERLLAFSAERAKTARHMQELESENESFIVFSKAVAYYHRALAESKHHGGQKETFLSAKHNLLVTAQTLSEHTQSAEVRAKFQSLSAELETLPEPTF